MLSLINLQWTLVSFRGKKLYFGLLQRIGSSDLKLTSFAPINSKLQHSLPRATNGHLTVVYVGGWWVWTLAGCGGEVSSIPSRTHVFFLLMWRFLGEEFTFLSWLRKKGLQGLGFKAWSVWRKLRSLILPCMENWQSNPALGWASELNLAKGMAGIWTNQSSKAQMPEGLLRCCARGVEASNWWTHWS